MPTKGDPRSSIALKLDEGLPPLPTRRHMPASYRPVTPAQPTFDPFYTTDPPALPPAAAAPSPMNQQWPGGSGEDQFFNVAETAAPSIAETRGDDKAGYGNPPKRHQFKKGVSGNPKGRPPKPRPEDLPDVPSRLKAMAEETRLVDGKPMTGQEEMLRAVLAQARQGKVSALKYLRSIHTQLLKVKTRRFIIEGRGGDDDDDDPADEAPPRQNRPPPPPAPPRQNRPPQPPDLRDCLDKILAETIWVNGEKMTRHEDLCRCIYELARQGKLSMVKWVCPVPAKPIRKGSFEIVVPPEKG